MKFGIPCFILHGNMVTDTMKSSARFRVGRPKDAAALSAMALAYAKALPPK